ncbi:hypothetical protein [Escherichia coli]
MEQFRKTLSIAFVNQRQYRAQQCFMSKNW